MKKFWETLPQVRLPGPLPPVGLADASSSRGEGRPAQRGARAVAASTRRMAAVRVISTDPQGRFWGHLNGWRVGVVAVAALGFGAMIFLFNMCVPTTSLPDTKPGFWVDIFEKKWGFESPNLFLLSQDDRYIDILKKRVTILLHAKV